MKNFISSPNPLIKGVRKSETFVFLAGPIQGASKWRELVSEIPEVTWISPEREYVPDTGLSSIEWEKQVDWETSGLRVSDVVIFWIPKPEKEISGRDYAQTTRMELLECLSRKKNLIVGIDPSIHARRYMIKKCKDYGLGVVHETLDGVIEELKSFLKNRKDGVFFTSDTHFSSPRTLELSKRPFKDINDMNLSLIERWNSVVTPNSTVYHLGDFGDYNILKYLNGNIRLVLGNYEIKEREDLDLSPSKYIEWLKEKGFTTVSDSSYYKPLYTWMAHEPLKVKGYGSKYSLFGHIHGRQRVKKFGIDVGVDGNNYYPMSEKDVKFYLDAIDKGYYDDEVFSY